MRHKKIYIYFLIAIHSYVYKYKYLYYKMQVCFKYRKVKLMGIHYNKLWDTLNDKGYTKYTLTRYFELSPRLITKLQRNEPINTTTIDKLCSILQCNVEDIVTYEENEENLRFRNDGLKRIEDKKKSRSKK